MWVTRRTLELGIAGEPFADGDLRFYRSLGRRCAFHDVSRPVLEAMFTVGVTVATREFWRTTPTHWFVELAELTGWTAVMVEQARQASVHAFTVVGDEALDPLPSIMAEALLDGEPAYLAAQPGSSRLAPSYLVLACAVAGSAGSAGSGGFGGQPDAAVRRVIEAVPGALHYGDLCELAILLPVHASLQAAEDTAAGLVAGLRSLTGRTVHAARSYRHDLAGIPDAFREARRTLSLAEAIPEAGARPYRMEDLLVELAISRQPEIRQRLASLLVPLGAGADLRRTLEVLLACNLDRERAARKLRIHRRTLRYRMDRVRELSGIDPDTPHGLHLIRAALAAGRLPDLEAAGPAT
jgi:hypothetical protein